MASSALSESILHAPSTSAAWRQEANSAGFQMDSKARAMTSGSVQGKAANLGA